MDKVRGLVGSLVSTVAGTKEVKKELGGYGYASTTTTTNEEEPNPQEEGGETTQIINADLYTTLEPCSTRTSALRSCTQAILDFNTSATNPNLAGAGSVHIRIARVFIGAAEPPDFVKCEGARLLGEGGVEVVWLGERTVKLVESDLVELVEEGRDVSEEVKLGDVCLRAARRGNQ